jgi:hypothetical protein
MNVQTIGQVGAACRRAWVVALILAMALAPAVVTGADPSRPLDPPSTADTLPPDTIDAAVRQLTRPPATVPLPPIPDHPMDT